MKRGNIWATRLISAPHSTGKNISRLFSVLESIFGPQQTTFDSPRKLIAISNKRHERGAPFWGSKKQRFSQRIARPKRKPLQNSGPGDSSARPNVSLRHLASRANTTACHCHLLRLKWRLWRPRIPGLRTPCTTSFCLGRRMNHRPMHRRSNVAHTRLTPSAWRITSTFLPCIATPTTRTCTLP